MISDMLLEDHGVYVQPINYPTVPKGTERLRITPTPMHSDEMVVELRDALVNVWSALSIPRDVPADASVVKLNSGELTLPNVGG